MSDNISSSDFGTSIFAISCIFLVAAKFRTIIRVLKKYTDN